MLICPRFHCGERLVEQHDRALGRVAFVCRSCARNRAGFCRDCPRPLPSQKHLRCEACALEEKRRLDREAKARLYQDPAERRHLLALKRRSYAKPEVRARRRAYERQYRADHPRTRDDFDRAYGREWAREALKDPAYRKRVNARKRQRERQKRLERRGLETAA
jgi:hypothetical protein